MGRKAARIKAKEKGADKEPGARAGERKSVSARSPSLGKCETGQVGRWTAVARPGLDLVLQ